MSLFDLLPSVLDITTAVMVNKIERGNIGQLFLGILLPAWVFRYHIHRRRREWLKLTPNEQLWRQHLANKQNRREMYPL